MVSSDSTDASIGKSLTQGIPVCRSLDGRVAFDAGTKRFVVGIGKEQMRHTSLSRYALIIGQEEFQFLSRSDVCHMQSSSRLFCESNGQFCAFVASLMVANERMETDRQIIGL